MKKLTNKTELMQIIRGQKIFIFAGIGFILVSEDALWDLVRYSESLKGTVEVVKDESGNVLHCLIILKYVS